MKKLPTILFVDDQQHMLRLLEFNLRKTGARLHFAQSVQDALAQVARLGSELDAAVLDYELPDETGLDLARRIRTLPGLADLPLIMLTARGQAALRREAEELGIRAFLTKPFSPRELVDLVARVLGDEFILKLE